MTYLDGLRAAEALCSERSIKHSRDVRRWEAEADKALSAASALEALKCSIAIKHLVDQLERVEGSADDA